MTKCHLAPNWYRCCKLKATEFRWFQIYVTVSEYIRKWQEYFAEIDRSAVTDSEEEDSAESSTDEDEDTSSIAEDG